MSPLLVRCGFLLVVGCVIGCGCIANSQAKVFEATFNLVGDPEDSGVFVYLSKYCFWPGGKHVGKMDFQVTSTPAVVPGAYLLAFNDEPSSWPSVESRISQMTCAQLVQDPSVKYRHSLSSKANTTVFVDEMDPHFWFVGIVSCSSAFLSVSVRLSFTNQDASFWHYQFGYDIRGILPLYLCYFIFYSLLMIAYIWGVLKIRARGSIPTMYHLYGIVLALELVAVFFYFIHYLKYASDGVGIPGLEGFADVIQLASRITFLAIVLAISLGWTITFADLRWRKTFTVLFTILIMLHIAVYMWSELVVDPASVVYVYDTPPGITLACLRLPILVWFFYEIYVSHSHESVERKRKFYRWIAIVYSFWILCLPIIVLAASYAPSWNKHMIVSAFDSTTYFLALLFMLVFMWPSVHPQFMLGSVNTSDADNVPDTADLPYQDL